MYREIERYLRLGSAVEIIYVDQKRHLSKRKVKLIRLCDAYVKAFCYVKRAPRMFKIGNILAIAPAQNIKKRSS